jgi:hypothetical protein
MRKISAHFWRSSFSASAYFDHQFAGRFSRFQVLLRFSNFGQRVNPIDAQFQQASQLGEPQALSAVSAW